MSARHDRIVALAARLNAQLAGTARIALSVCPRCARLVRVNVNGLLRSHKCPHGARCIWRARLIFCLRCREVAARIPEEK